MKKIIVFFILVFQLASIAYAGGITSKAILSEIHSIEVEHDKVTIIGSGVLELWSVATEEANSHYYILGEKAITQKFKMTHAKIELIPYFSHPDIIFVNKPNAAMKQLGKDNWQRDLPTYKKIKEKDEVIIQFQGELITITQGKVKNMLGQGTMTQSK